MRRFDKMQLANKLGYSPFLRLLLFNVWFRLTLLGMILAGAAAGLALPRMWQTSPEGTNPVIKVSLLDLWQARSLRRTAERYAANGKMDEALQAWGNAVGNNQADLDLVRGYLRTAAQAPQPDRFARPILGQSAWLLRQGGTNLADLELITRVFSVAGLETSTTALLGAVAGTNLPPALEVNYLKALFKTGQVKRFNERWQAQRARLPADPELDLVHAAYLAGWETGAEAAEARKQLLAAGEAGPHAALASRLLLQVAHRKNELAAAELALKRLSDHRADTLRDHLLCWRLLLAADLNKEVEDRVLAFPRQPDNPIDACELAQVCADAGLRERARLILDRAADQFGYSAAIVVRYSTLLVADKDWTALRSLALKLRERPFLPDSIVAFSHFMEGQAELGEGRPEAATVAFDRLGQFAYEEPLLGLSMANGLLQAQRPQPALATLRRLEPLLEQSRDYWATYTQAANAAKDTAALLYASRKAHEIDPANPAIASNYAAALLLERTNAVEAARITGDLLGRNPGQAVLTINHATALVALQRHREAYDLLAKTDVRSLAPAELTQYYIARFEACLGLARFEEAWACTEFVVRDYLYPVQTRWLDEALRQLPPRALVSPSNP